MSYRDPQRQEEYRRRWVEQHPGRQAEYARKYRAVHPGLGTVLKQRWAAKDPDRAKAADRKQFEKHPLRTTESRRFRFYGASPDWVRDQLVGQAGRCAICGEVLNPGRDTHLDHDHVTGKPRGLLCRACNQMLGLARDNARILGNAVTYLERS